MSVFSNSDSTCHPMVRECVPRFWFEFECSDVTHNNHCLCHGIMPKVENSDGCAIKFKFDSEKNRIKILSHEKKNDIIELCLSANVNSNISMLSCRSIRNRKIT